MKSVLQILVLVASITVIAMGMIMSADYLGPHDYFVAYDVKVYNSNINQNEVISASDILYTMSGCMTLTTANRRITSDNLNEYVEIAKSRAFEHFKNVANEQIREKITEENTEILIRSISPLF